MEFRMTRFLLLLFLWTEAHSSQKEFISIPIYKYLAPATRSYLSLIVSNQINYRHSTVRCWLSIRSGYVRRYIQIAQWYCMVLFTRTWVHHLRSLNAIRKRTLIFPNKCVSRVTTTQKKNNPIHIASSQISWLFAPIHICSTIASI